MYGMKTCVRNRVGNRIGNNGQQDADPRATAHFALHVNQAASGTNDVVHRRQSNARPFADFGREERLE
jgi:hypothetical protein